MEPKKKKNIFYVVFMYTPNTQTLNTVTLD